MPRDRCSNCHTIDFNEQIFGSKQQVAGRGRSDHEAFGFTVMQREDRLNTTLLQRDRRALLSRQRAYIRLHARVDRLEDAIGHFHNVINELYTRVSTLEKKSKPLAKDD